MQCKYLYCTHTHTRQCIALAGFYTVITNMYRCASCIVIRVYGYT